MQFDFVSLPNFVGEIVIVEEPLNREQLQAAGISTAEV